MQRNLIYSVLTSFCFLLLFPVVIQAQTYRVHQIRDDGSRGRLLRIETFENGHLVKSDNYQPNGKIAFTQTQKYENNLMVGQIKTMKIDHEFDLIWEYTYDFYGRKIGELFGNNRTGKWGSKRFLYTPQNDIKTVFIHEKNGECSRKAVYTYTYDAEGRKTYEARQDIDMETEEITAKQSITYEYFPGINKIKIIQKDVYGNTLLTEIVVKDSNGKIASKTIEMVGAPIAKIKYFYTNNRLIKEEEYRSGKLSLTTTYRYFSDEQLMEKKYRYANGKFGGEVWSVNE